MGKYRRGRVNEEIQKTLTDVLRVVKDPRVGDNFVSITAVDCTADLKYAKIYYSHLTGDVKEVAEGLKSSCGFIRRALAQNLNLRITPELHFIRDESVAYGAHIASVLKTLNITPAEEEDAENGDDAKTEERSEGADA